MTSNELNELIHSLCDRDDLGFEAFGGKAIPYIGWFWRDVDFDAESYTFGVMPIFNGPLESNDQPRVGFMENNKWDYEEVYSTPEQSKEIRQLLEAAVTTPNSKTLRAVYDAVQLVAQS